MWFSTVLDVLTKEKVDFVVAVLYHVWRARNSAVWGALPLPRRTLATASATLGAWRGVHALSPAVTATVAAVGGIMHAHPHHATCYFDASYHPSTMKASFGATLLTAGGAFIAACSGPLPDCFSPLMAEAAAYKEALSWLRGRGLAEVALSTDCAQLRTQIHSTVASFSYVGLLLDACRAAMSTFNSCIISLIPRSANVIAHTLASASGSQANILY
ncbi:uncharacterized protein LOC115999530 [Ipomoea triloba]|uniref:uncharacterized protein LOC115999530 n=1 Tax=Ipomoea triloba TaxID=35885 RepID=UPI00125CEDBD|nr:uncharacterized protein LOC115999530 [Ipomoea triloba]